MNRRPNRFTFRMTDQQQRRFEMLLKGHGGGRRLWTWTDLVLCALQELWEKCGSPEPPKLEVVRQTSSTNGKDLFSFTKRPRPATRSAPTRPHKPKRRKR